MACRPAPFATRRSLAWLFAFCLVLTGLLPTAEAASKRSIEFMGQSFNLNKFEDITNGNALYFAPGAQDPDQSADEIIVNFYDRQSKEGAEITPEGIADRMQAQAKARGGTVIMPFKVPDPADKSRFVYYVTMYYVYPQDGNGDIWLSKMFQSGDRAVGILYKHQVNGANADAIAANARAWLVQHVKDYSSALENIAVPGRN